MVAILITMAIAKSGLTEYGKHKLTKCVFYKANSRQLNGEALANKFIKCAKKMEGAHGLVREITAKKQIKSRARTIKEIPRRKSRRGKTKRM